MSTGIEPLHISFEVDCDPSHAFETWTAQTSGWWPATHTVSTEPGLRIEFEGRLGGRIFERTGSGAEFDWGEVTAWEPPHRLVYTWHLRVDRADATEVEVRFVELPGADGRARTRVEIEHRGWERLGSRGVARRDANRAGWNGLLPHFIQRAEGRM